MDDNYASDMNESTPAISCTEVLFRYGNEVVLDGVTFTINSGDYVGIIGGNGSGKTTLLKVILGLLRPESGSVALFGTALADYSEWERIGYVPQYVFRNDSNFPATVREIVASGDTGKKMKEDGVAEALRRVDAEHLIGRRVGELSGGERQRVFIARALVDNPRLLILDEPTTGIDQHSEQEFYALLGRLNHSGLTILLVSHDIDTVTREVKTVLCLNRRIVCFGPPQQLAGEGVLSALYGEGRHVLHHGHQDH